MKSGDRVKWNGKLIYGPLRQNIDSNSHGTIKDEICQGVFWVKFDEQEEAMSMGIDELELISKSEKQ